MKAQFKPAKLPGSGTRKSAPLLLKYLFGAQLADGTEVYQTQADVSVVNASRPASFDIAEQDEDGGPKMGAHGRVVFRPDIHLFQLMGEGHVFLVDLRTGHFEIDGAPFAVAGDPIPDGMVEARLIYFKRRRHDLLCQIALREDGQVELQSGTESAQECEYHFGWSIEHEGRSYSRVLVLI